MSAHTIPELALSDSSETSSAYHEVAYDPATSGPWVDDDDELEAVEPTVDDAEVIPPTALTPWNASGWDDTAFVRVWAAAREEYMMHHDPISPYVPFKADRDLVDLSKQRTADSWKIKMQAGEQLDRQRAEASGMPPPGTKERTSLWYSSLFRPAAPPSKNPSKKKKPAKKAKTTHQHQLPSGAPLAVDDDDSYRPLSPPAFAPASPTASTSALPELDISTSAAAVEGEEPSWDATWVEGADDEEAIEYEDDWEEETYRGAGTIQLDFGGGGKTGGHWDDGDLVKGWEREKKQWEAKHGKGKSWLDQAMEDAALAASAAASSSPPPAAALPPPGPALDKIARRNLERYGRATTSVEPAAAPEELSYD